VLAGRHGEAVSPASSRSYFSTPLRPAFVRDYLALSNRGVHEAYAWQFVTATLLYGSPWHFLGTCSGCTFSGAIWNPFSANAFFVFVFKRRNWRRARAFVSNAVRGNFVCG